MKANVFERAEPDGSVIVYGTGPDGEHVEGRGFDLQDACDKFVAELRRRYPWTKFNLVAADE